MLTLGCSLVNAPPMEGNLDATGDTVHAVSKDYSSASENTLFATAGLYVQAAIFPNINQTFGPELQGVTAGASMGTPPGGPWYAPSSRCTSSNNSSAASGFCRLT